MSEMLKPMHFTYTGQPEEALTSFGTKVPYDLLRRLDVHLAINQMTVRAWFASVLEKLPDVPEAIRPHRRAKGGR